MKTKLSGLCKTRWVERHTCYETFYEFYKYICLCLEAIVDPSAHSELDLMMVPGNGILKLRLKPKDFFKY